VDTRASRSSGAGRLWAGRAMRAVAAVTVAVSALTIPSTPAGADTYANNFFPSHWGPNPYFNLPPEHLAYRSVYLIDNTGDPSLSVHIKTMADIVNSLHLGYNANYPVIFYYKDFHLAAGQPCAVGATQFAVICKDETLGGSPSATAPASAAIWNGGVNHIFYALGRFRPSVVDPMCAGDKFTLAVQVVSNLLGLDYNLSDPSSAMYPTLPLGRCTFNGWVGPDLVQMNQMYSHFAG